MCANPISTVDSMTFAGEGQMDTLHMLLPRTLINVVHDTVIKTDTIVKTNIVYVKDTIYINKCGSMVLGRLSVSADKYVSFAKGNLQYQASSKTWRFAKNQYDYIGSDNSNISDTYSGWIDLFGWGTGNHPTDISTNNSDYQTFVDWGTNANGTDIPNTWRTLSADEWLHIIYTRSNADKLFGFGTINGVAGMILLPDGWITPNDIVFTPAVEKGLRDNKMEDYAWSYGEYHNCFLDNIYSAYDWQEMENAGAIFLPVAGSRYGREVIMDGIGYYLTSTGDDDNGCAYGMDFRLWIFFAYHCYSRRCGFPVRLVQDVN